MDLKEPLWTPKLGSTKIQSSGSTNPGLAHQTSRTTSTVETALKKKSLNKCVCFQIESALCSPLKSDEKVRPGIIVGDLHLELVVSGVSQRTLLQSLFLYSSFFLGSYRSHFYVLSIASDFKLYPRHPWSSVSRAFFSGKGFLPIAFSPCIHSLWSRSSNIKQPWFAKLRSVLNKQIFCCLERAWS